MKNTIMRKIGFALALLFCFSIGGCQMVDGNSSNSAEESVSSENNSQSDENNDNNESEEDTADRSDNNSSEVKEEDEADLSVHFLYLGNQSSGDSTLIKVGDTEVLIDAGSTRGSADTVVGYLDDYCEDGVLEYVIATHADQDHISAFVGDEAMFDGVFELFRCETIIDFPKTTKNTNIYKEYVALRDKQVAAGAVHYTALECWNNENGAQRTYELGNDITLQILYQKYYEESTTNENNNSVCVLLSHGDDHYLFTGDLETSGEKSLLENNTLPQCKVFKAGHHGSNTSNTAELMAVIQPEIVVANCVAGDQYAFPHQEFIDNVAPYTSQVYIPAAIWDGGLKKLNGNIVVSSKKGAITVECTNNNTLFKDTPWFAANRQLPAQWQ